MRARQITVFVVVSMAIAAIALALDFGFDVALARGRAAALAAERDLALIETSLASWRQAQAGYVATGQVPSFWFTRAAERSADIEAALVRRHAAAQSATAKAQYDLATSAVGTLNGLDGKARDLATSDRRFEASDLIFTEAVGPAQRLSDAVSAAREAERQASESSMVRTRWLRLGLNGVAILLLVLAVLIFQRISKQADAAAEEALASLAAGPSMDGVVSPARVMTPAPSPVNLAAAAELCVDLGRVMDGRDVPALFERIGPVLGAKGLILWIADAGGALLRPSLTLGYPDRMVERLGTLQADGDNVTSLAFRSRRSQAVNGTAAAAHGAIAVPLVTAAGCVGVLSAEVSRTRPDHETLAVARMIAAQIAAIVAPGDAIREAEPPTRVAGTG